MDEQGAEGLASERPYRSRTQPPCQRCRSRKQRCMTRPNGICINCQIAGTPCVINSPGEAPSTRNRARTARTDRQTKRQKTSNGEAMYSTSNATGETSVQNAAAREPSFISPTPTVTSRSPTMLPTPAQVHLTAAPYNSMPTTAPTSPGGMGGNFSSILWSWDYSTSSSPETPDNASFLSPSSSSPPCSNFDQVEYDLRPLDADAGEDFEPHYVGATAERDGLVLSAIANVARGDTSESSETSRHGSGTPGPVFRVRQVSSNPSEPVFFLFERTAPYGTTTDENAHLIEDFMALVGRDNAPRLLQHYKRIDGLAVPIWSPEHFTPDPQCPVALICTYMCRGLIHDDQLRHLTGQGWKLVLQVIRPEAKRARLSTIQANLLDLDGRPSLDPAGNSVVLGQTIAAARLLGLHLDCTDWSIPTWEKKLRIKLWWGLLQQDKWSALCSGRSSYIHFNDWNVPLPASYSHSAQSELHLDTFVALSELTLILDRVLRDLHVVRKTTTMKDSLTLITTFGFELDAWKLRLDAKIEAFTRTGTPSPPGLCSLQLSYLAVALLLARTALDRDLPPNVLRTAQESAFRVTEQVIAFVTSLTEADLRGYWTIYTAFHLSTTVLLLIRLTLQSDLNDQSDTAAWQRSVHQLHIFIQVLVRCKRTVRSFELGDLALARAKHLIPLLTQRIPELAVVMEPFDEPMSATMSQQSVSHSPTHPPTSAHPVNRGTNSLAQVANQFDYAQGLDHFFPEISEPDWAALRDFMPMPFMANAVPAMIQQGGSQGEEWGPMSHHPTQTHTHPGHHHQQHQHIPPQHPHSGQHRGY